MSMLETGRDGRSWRCYSCAPPDFGSVVFGLGRKRREAELCDLDGIGVYGATKVAAISTDTLWCTSRWICNNRLSFVGFISVGSSTF